MFAYALVFVIAFLSNQASGQYCNATNCVAPACRCASTSIPGNLELNKTPQFVLLSFDGAITTSNTNNYTALLKNKYNPDGCPLSFTFFVSHEYTDYSLVHQLYYKGQEIASHSITKESSPSEQWKNKDASQWEAELGGMRTIAAKFANIPANSIQGERAPYIQTSGNATMQSVMSLGMYDTSYPNPDNRNRPIWPYTLDQGYQHSQCSLAPCPTGNFPGVWTFPMIPLVNSKNLSCIMIDGCGDPATTAEALSFLKENFNRHYTTNKAPFGLYMNANAWFLKGAHLFDAYDQFLQYLQTLNDVYVVSMSQALKWMKNPVPLDQMSTVLSCPALNPSTCTPRNCFYDGTSSPGGLERFMKSCVSCPNNFPWVGNPLGA